MPNPIYVEGGIVVPTEAMEMKAVRSSGPGGQNVNKVASKIELRVNLDRIQGLTDAARNRLLHLVAKRLDSSGRLLITSQRTRDQFQNLEDARHKVSEWIERAIHPPAKRIASRPTLASRERRLQAKRLLSRRKTNRRSQSFKED